MRVDLEGKCWGFLSFSFFPPFFFLRQTKHRVCILEKESTEIRQNKYLSCSILTSLFVPNCYGPRAVTFLVLEAIHQSCQVTESFKPDPPGSFGFISEVF